VRRYIAVLSALLIAAASAEAQIAWDAPPLVSPAAPAGVSLFLFSPAGGDLGGLLTFRHAAGPVGVGYRFSVTDDGPGDGVAFGAGIDISGFLARGLEESELDVMWFSGAGLGLGDETVVSFPLGALIGWTGGEGGTTLSPYAGGHIALDISSLEQDNVNLGASADLGLDIGLSSGLLIRFGASVGDRDALAVGVRLKT
jgi:hypothetical protein